MISKANPTQPNPNAGLDVVPVGVMPVNASTFARDAVLCSLRCWGILSTPVSGTGGDAELRSGGITILDPHGVPRAVMRCRSDKFNGGTLWQRLSDGA